MTQLSYQDVSLILRYDPETGGMLWRVNRSASARAGAIAGTISGDGYRKIGISRKYYAAHRLAWLLVYKEWPSGVIDHINGVKDDNRLSNLRHCKTNALNCRNQTKPRNNTSGYKGVYWHIRKDKWVASIRVDRISKHLGYFDTPESAAAAYDEASNRFHGIYGRPSLKDTRESIDA